MAIDITTPSPGKFGWIINATSADASGCEQLKAAPAAGLSIIVDHLTINNGANAINIIIGAGKNGAAVTAALIGPVAMAANTSLQWDFPTGMVLTAATALTVDASGPGQFAFSPGAGLNDGPTGGVFLRCIDQAAAAVRIFRKARTRITGECLVSEKPPEAAGGSTPSGGD